jgi:hypothetical protein
MDCSEAREEFSALLDGELVPEARAAVEAHLFECAECLRQLDGLKRVDTLYRRLEPVGAPSGFEAQVRERLGGSGLRRLRATPARRRPWWPILAAAAMVVVVAGAIVVQSGFGTAPLMRIAKQESADLAANAPMAESAMESTAAAAESAPMRVEKSAPSPDDTAGSAVAEESSRAVELQAPGVALEAMTYSAPAAPAQPQPEGVDAGEAESLPEPQSLAGSAPSAQVGRMALDEAAPATVPAPPAPPVVRRFEQAPVEAPSPAVPQAPAPPAREAPRPAPRTADTIASGRVAGSAPLTAAPPAVAAEAPPAPPAVAMETPPAPPAEEPSVSAEAPSAEEERAGSVEEGVFEFGAPFVVDDAAKPAPAQAEQTEQAETRVVGRRSFVLQDGVWRQSNYDGQDTTRVILGSEAAKELLEEYPDIAPVLELGERIVLKLGRRWYEIAPAGSDALAP